MNDNLDLRGARQSQLHHTVRSYEAPEETIGIIAEIDRENQLAKIAIPGGEPGTNGLNVKVITLEPGEERVVDNPNAHDLGSVYSLYEAELPSDLANSPLALPGAHVNVRFARGRTRPVVTNYILARKNPNNSVVPVVLIDQDGGGFRFVGNGRDTAWTAVEGVPGHRYAPYFQNLLGGASAVAQGFNMGKLLGAADPSPKLIREALKPSTPAGWAVFVDLDGRGHHAVFGSAHHVMAKEQNTAAMGSNQPESSHLLNPLNDLATALGITADDKTPMNFDPDDRFLLSPATTGLAAAELEAWKAGRNSYPGLAELYEGFEGLKDTGSGALAVGLKTASEGATHAGLNYRLGAALAAGVHSTGRAVSGAGNLLQNLDSSLAELPLNPAAHHPNLLAELDGTNQAWAALVAALRIALLTSTQSSRMMQALKEAPLTLYKFTGDSTTGLAVPNLFGFPADSVQVGKDGLKGNKDFLQVLELPGTSRLAPSSGKDPYTYGDLMHYNLHDIRLDAVNWEGTWSGHSDILVPNSIALLGTTTTFNDRLYFGAAGITDANNSPYSLDMIRSWTCGLYAAQVRTLVQELALLMRQYPEDVMEATGAGGPQMLRAAQAVTVSDGLGSKKQVQTRTWTTSYLGYALVRLFTGTPGREAARDLLSLYAGQDDPLTEDSFQKVLGSRTPAGDALSQLLWSTIGERYKLVTTTLARSRNLWRA